MREMTTETEVRKFICYRAIPSCMDIKVQHSLKFNLVVQRKKDWISVAFHLHRLMMRLAVFTVTISMKKNSGKSGIGRL